MLRRTIERDGQNWDQLFPFLMFAISEVPLASTGFSPFELLFSHRPWGLLDVMKENLEQQSSPHNTVIEHIEDMIERINALVMPIVKEHLQQAQEAQSRVYNRPTQPREFAPGDRIMVLVPMTVCKFLATWRGPYEVLQKLGL